MDPDDRSPRRPRIGISSCLLGELVRYDGGHKHEPSLTGALGPLVEWVPVCPEVELGLGVPREPIHLVERGGEIHLVGTESGKDHTGTMRRYARQRVETLAGEGLSGYVLKSNSPSCGLEVPVCREDAVTRATRGLFAEALLERLPDLPVEEETRLREPDVREQWLKRVLSYENPNVGGFAPGKKSAG